MFYNGCDYLSMLGLKLNHVSKRGPRSCSFQVLAELQILHLEYDTCYLHRMAHTFIILSLINDIILKLGASLVHSAILGRQELPTAQ